MTSSLTISAELTYIRIRGLLSYFMQASKQYGVSITLLLAVASRESRMGLSLTPEGTGDNGNGIGIMQIDRRYHPGFTNRYSPLDHQANINYGAQFLAKLMAEFGGNIPQTVAAYNAGASRVQAAIRAGLPPDAVTTGGDYGRDVLQRKQLITDLMDLSKATSMSIYAIPLALIALATYNYVTTPINS